MAGGAGVRALLTGRSIAGNYLGLFFACLQAEADGFTRSGEKGCLVEHSGGAGNRYSAIHPKNRRRFTHYPMSGKTLHDQLESEDKAMKLYSDGDSDARMGEPGRWASGSLAALTLLTVIYATPNAAAAPALRTIHSFAATPADGSNPSDLILGADGVLYGVTQDGGANQLGAVFSMTPPASPGLGWTETVLYSFTGLNGQGTTPFGIVTKPGGGLYGFTGFGGNSGDPCGGGCGTLFSLTPPASPGGAWTEATLYSFTGGSDGFFPSSLILSGGILYGTVDTQNGFGQVFSLTPPENRAGTWRYTVLYSPPNPGNAALPLDILMGADGVLYGTIEMGVYGGVFSLTPPASPAGAWTYAAVYAFAGGSDANAPNGLTAGSLSGDHPILYGTSDQGGTGSCHLGCGTIFSLTPPVSPGGPWTEAVLYSFQGADDGEQPVAGVTIGSDGVLYATATAGGLGTGTGNGFGTVISLTPSSSPSAPWTADVLAQFDYTDGARPSARVVIGSGGTLYGITLRGGAFEDGTVYKLKP